MKAQKSYYVSATAIRKLDFTRYVFLFRRHIDQCSSVNLMLSLRTVITDFEKAAMNAVSILFSQMLSVVGVVSTSASLGGAEFTPLVCQKTGPTKTKNRLLRSGWCCFSDCRCCHRMETVQHC